MKYYRALSLIFLSIPLAVLAGGAVPKSGSILPIKLSDGVSLISKAGSRGQWLEFCASEPFSEREFAVGLVPEVEKFVGNTRGRSACWMDSITGDSLSALPREAQFLLLRLNNGRYLAMVPLLDGAFRCSLRGDSKGMLQLLAESGDNAITTNRMTGLYVEEGSDPYELVHSAAATVRARLHPGESVSPPQVPDFVRYLGWCTWNAFYADVSLDKMLLAMNQFRDGGVMPGFVLVDNGWFQFENKMLTSYDADPVKFPGGLGHMIRALKETNGVSRVLIWHAFNGYWSGSDPKKLPDIGIRMVKPHFPSWFAVRPGVSSENTDDTMSPNFYPGHYRGLIGQPDIGMFYSTLHKQLQEQGADGVKIDAMGWVEALGEGRGGRVSIVREMVDAATCSEREFFNRNVIWCSSCSTDIILQAPRSAIMRSSWDFLPDKPESHGRHVVINAHNSLWMGEFIIPDWDMFQSGHLSGAFHAAARAISGGPAYIADELGKTDFAVLRKLCFSDRTVPLCLGPARPSPDSLFLDPARENQLFKVFNHNPVGGGVLGVFNASYKPDQMAPVRGEAGPNDIYGLAGSEFVVYRHVEGTLRIMKRSETAALALAPLQFEILTMAPIENGFAAIGLTDKYNSGGCITAIRRGKGNHVEIDLRDGGEFLAWSKREPKSVEVQGKPVPFRYDAGALYVSIPCGKEVTVIVN
jgi:raffinose synthase